MPKGYLIVKSTTANGDLIVEDAEVKISSGFLKEPIVLKTGADGRTSAIQLETVSSSGTLDSSSEKQTYEPYVVEISKEGFITEVIKDVQIFENETTIVNVPFKPLDGSNKVEVSDNQSTFFQGSAPAQDSHRASNPAIRDVTIPEKIIVHLGPPTSQAEDLTVNFTDYVKNVASSEIYPTWPVECLRANILCIISIALNRIYTEWYRLKGYPFDITSSPGYDQAFVKNRNIFDSVSKVVDEIFNEYVSRRNANEPLFTTYCDGKKVTCTGLKQWGSLELAEKGMNALEILRYYYGDDVDIVISNDIRNIDESYPGKPLKLGDSSADVYIMQRKLNRISLDYPNIPKIYPTTGIFDSRTESAVKEFQTQFEINPDGIIGKSTWYKISYVYISVTKLAQLQSEGESIPEEDLKYRGKVLREGDRGNDVAILQYLLQSCSQFYSYIPEVIIDGRFGYGTKIAVQEFQKNNELTPDGIVGEETWNKIVATFSEIYPLMPQYPNIVPYPGKTLKIGSKGVYVKLLQQYFNMFSYFIPNFKQVKIDSIFGPETQQNVIDFQKKFNLKPDGVVGEDTWNKIIDIYTQLIGILEYPDVILKQGSKNDYVKYMQYYLSELSNYYPNIPKIEVDGYFGPDMKEAVKAFQKEFGIKPDGTIGKQTWNKILEVYINAKHTRDYESLSISVIDLLNNQRFKRNMYKKNHY